jgi:hypothetical protein
MKKHADEKKTKADSDEEFERWFESTDTGSLVKEGQATGMAGIASRGPGRPRIGRKISLILPEETIQDLTKRAARRGMGYQTYVRMVLMNLKEDDAV